MLKIHPHNPPPVLYYSYTILTQNLEEPIKETLKVFATKGVANFQWLLLPSLDEKLRTRGGNVNPLNNLLTAIGGDVNNPPKVTRAMICESDPEAEWVTKDIVIRVQRGE